MLHLTSFSLNSNHFNASQVLVETAQLCVEKAQNCLESCLSNLVALLAKGVEERDTAQGVGNIQKPPTVRPRRTSTSSSTTTQSMIPDGHTVYIVKSTDSLAAIALTHKMTVSQLRELNNIHHSGQLLPGQLLIVKSPTAVDTTKSALSPHTPVVNTSTPMNQVTETKKENQPIVSQVRFFFLK